MEKNNNPIPYHINDFLDWLEIEKGVSSKTQENYARFLKRFLVWLKQANLDNLKPHELTPEHIWQYRAYLARQHAPKTSRSLAQENPTLKKTTQNYYLIALRSLLNFFADRNISSLPAEKIKLAREKDARVVSFLTIEQLKRLFESPNVSNISGLRDRAILETFFSTGMRIAELLSLNRAQIKINQETKDLEVVIIGKGGKPRPVYISERAIFWLKKYLEKRTDTEPALFVNHYKKNSEARLSPRAVQKSIKRYAIASGIPLTTTPHVLRHTFATDLLNQGVDFRILQEFLGHKSPLATQIYAHVTNKKLRDVHRKFHSGMEIKNE